MSLYTHWVCFDCRKSFHNFPIGGSEERTHRSCPDCAKPMRDIGVYFEPPRRRNKKSWEIMKLLGDAGYRFSSEGGKAFIESFILTEYPKIEEVRRRIESDGRHSKKLPAF